MCSSDLPGSDLTLKVWRDDREIDVPLTLGQMPETVLERPRLAMLSNLREALGLELEPDSLKVADVTEDSMAARFGLKKGQVIKSVNDRSVDSADAFATALIDAGFLKGREVSVTVDDNGTSQDLKFSASR